MDVSIIIVNYNTVNLIINAVDSIIEKTEGINYEIIIVDNNSTDNAEIILKERYNDKVKFIASPDNLGFGRANNLGLEFAEGRNILFLNPDTILINNAIKILSNYLDHNKNAGACGGNLYDEELKPTISYEMNFPSIYSELNLLSHGLLNKIRYGRNSIYNHKNKNRKVAYISGADLMIKKSILNKIGSFNPRFFMYYEETELCFRIKNTDHGIVSIPTAKIQHLEGKSFGELKINRKKLEMQKNSKLTFFELCHSKLYKNICYFLQWLTINSSLAISSFYKKETHQYWLLLKEITTSKQDNL